MPIKMHLSLATIALLATLSQASAATLSFKDVQFPGTGVPLKVTGNDGTQFTFTEGSGSQFQAYQNGADSPFSPGTYRLIPGLGQYNPITITFSQMLNAISIPTFAYAPVGTVTTAVFYDGSQSVRSESLADNMTLTSAPTFTFNGPITRVVISTNTTAASTQIGDFSYRVAAVPLPGAAPLFGAALMMLGVGAYAAKRRTAASR